MDYSVVIPLYNERDSVAPLHVELTRVMQSLGRAYELIFVDDGSVDGSIEALRQIKSGDQNVRVISLARNSGRILLGVGPVDTPEIAVPRTVAAALLVGVAASIALGVTAGPLTNLFTAAACDVGASR